MNRNDEMKLQELNMEASSNYQALKESSTIRNSISNTHNNNNINILSEEAHKENNFANNIQSQKPSSPNQQNAVNNQVYYQSGTSIYDKNLQIFYRYCAFHIPICLLSIIFIIFYFSGKSKIFSSEIAYFSNIGKNWAFGPIISVSEGCSDSDQKYKNILTDIWPGTTSGCSCTSGIFRGICNKTKRRSGCTSVEKTMPINYKTWKGKKICVERLQFNYLDLDIVNNPMQCASNQRSCGIIDSKNNYLCIDKKANCPVNDIRVYYDESYKPLSDSEKAIEFSVDYSKNNTKATMVFSNKFTEQKITSQLKPSTGIPCKNPYYENMNYPNYPLNYYFGRNSCKDFVDEPNAIIYETEYSELDTMSKLKFYKDNLIYDVVNALPQYMPQELQMDVSLYQRSYFGLSLSCLKDIKSQQLSDEMIAELNNLIKFEEYSSSMSSNTTFATLFLVFEIVTLFNAMGFITKGKKQKEYSKVGFFDFLIYLILFITLMVFCIFNLVYNSQISSLISSQSFLSEYFQDSRCVDSFTNNLFIKSINDMLSAKFYFAWNSIITYIVILFHIVFMVLGSKYLFDLTYY